jgi:DNA polymerase III alpha subunit (gram-positive type)
MRKRKYYVILDTETANSMDEPLCYDLGFAIVDRYGKIYEQHSFVIEEIFDNPDLMTSAYYAEKIPQYKEDIANGKRILTDFYTARKVLCDCVDKYNINIVLAHNARFDYKALTTTQRYLTKSKYRYFFPYGIEIWDTLKMSREILNHNKFYNLFCKKYDYYTPTNHQKRFTAEVLYQFIINDTNFTEKHTGLEDVLIEKEIFALCMWANPAIDGILWERKTA